MSHVTITVKLDNGTVIEMTDEIRTGNPLYFAQEIEGIIGINRDHIQKAIASICGDIRNGLPRRKIKDTPQA